MNALSKIREGLRDHGFSHIPDLLTSRSARVDFLAMARSLGQLVVPPGCDLSWPVIETRPAADAAIKRPFDRPERIGWHNDFTTHRRRPRWTMMWVMQPDPGGGTYGAWRVVSTRDVLRDIAARHGAVWEQMGKRRFPFGYKFEQQARYFKVLYSSRGPGLRFNGRALIEGSIVAHGEASPLIEEMVKIVEEAANRYASTIIAGTGDLLVADNWRSLHDRLDLSVHEGAAARVACLCFVDDPAEKGRNNPDPRGARWD